MVGIPVISLEVRGMKQTIQVALSNHMVEMDAYVQEALDKYCEPENIRSVVSMAATAAIDAAVKESVKHFFSYGGKGRKYIKEEVDRMLTEEMEFTKGQDDR